MAGVPSQSEWEGRGHSTPSLITNGSTATSSSGPGTPSLVRLVGDGEPFVPRPSGLKESFMDMSEEDSEGVPGGGRVSRMGMRRMQEQSPLARAGVGSGERTSEEDERYLRPSASARPGSRPGTSSSTVTTATETSGSYISFSTVPASTTSSSSTSRSESPPPMAMVGDKRDRVVSVHLGGDGDEDEDGHACALCGHAATSPSPTRELERPEMHPMFTVPLVTVPASAFGAYPRSTLPPSANMPYAERPANMDGRRDAGAGRGAKYGYAGGRKSERHASVPAAAAVGVPPARHDQNQHQNHMHLNGNGNANGAPVTTRAMAMVVTDKMTMTTLPSPPPKAKKGRRPQTAPPGTGDVASKFIEDAKAMRARESTVVDVDVGPQLTKHRESRFKAVLKGLLRWNV